MGIAHSLLVSFSVLASAALDLPGVDISRMSFTGDLSFPATEGALPVYRTTSDLDTAAFDAQVQVLIDRLGLEEEFAPFAGRTRVYHVLANSAHLSISAEEGSFRYRKQTSHGRLDPALEGVDVPRLMDELEQLSRDLGLSPGDCLRKEDGSLQVTVADQTAWRLAHPGPARLQSRQGSVRRALHGYPVVSMTDFRERLRIRFEPGPEITRLEFYRQPLEVYGRAAARDARDLAEPARIGIAYLGPTLNEPIDVSSLRTAQVEGIDVVYVQQSDTPSSTIFAPYYRVWLSAEGGEAADPFHLLVPWRMSPLP